jgi:WD40 repeat protein
MSPFCPLLLAACVAAWPVPPKPAIWQPEPLAILDQAAWSLALSPDGKQLVCFARKVRFWDVESRKQIATPDFLATPELPNDSFLNGRFLPDGKLLLTYRRDRYYSQDGQGDMTLMAYDLKTEKSIIIGYAHTNYGPPFVLSNDGRWAATAGLDECVVWDIARSQKLKTLKYDSMIGGLSFNPSGSLFAVGLQDGRVEVFDTKDWKLCHETKTPAMLTQACFVAEDRLGIFWFNPFEQQAACLLRDVVKESGRKDLRLNQGGPRFARSPKGSLIAIGTYCADTEHGNLRLYDLSKEKEVARWLGHDAGIEDMVFSPDGSLFYTSGKDGKVKIWEVRTLLNNKSSLSHP